MSSAKNERLLNLLICLMSTRQFLTAERIRRAVVAYGRDYSDKGQAAFERKFERDKEDLRELGVVIETGTNSFSDTVPGYRIKGRDNTLPDISLTPPEATAVALAADWWRSAQFASETQGAVRKLRAGGVAIEAPAGSQWHPQLRGSDPSFDVLLEAATDRREVRFDYRSRTSDPPVSRRHVQPWGLVSWKARWYVVGHDVDRGEQRVFRLSRIVGDVAADGPDGAFERPADLRLSAAVGGPEFSQPLRAVIALHGTDAPGLRRLARGVEQPADADRIAISARDVWSLAGIVTPYADQVEVLSPPEARAAVVRRLEQLAAMGDGTVA
ncbi:helix-turn-helix transcriptional regulator [Cumulibacter manganitolerans]|uniref:helix-turn-helix transcriptional regulator n=1 Tax=Cumulibacter manganitolerans TaxID=1884992 RepID=UPI001297AAF7|nr:WYL domain-containing protein [Cumulibacter manganitolerans]